MAAEYIVKLPELPEELLTLEFPNEMALAISISSHPVLYLTNIAMKWLPKGKRPNATFMESFLERIIVEKPDFSESPYLGFAMFNLLKFSTAKNHEDAVVKFANKQFEVLFRHPSINSSAIKVLKNYTAIKKYPNGITQYANLKPIESANKFKYPMEIFINPKLIK